MTIIEFPFRLPGMNDYTDACRRSPHSGARMKKEAQEDCEWVIRLTKKGKIREPVRLHYTFIEQNKKRDLDNIAGFAHKVIQDALVNQGVLSNDGWKSISGFSDSFLTGEKAKIILRIEEDQSS